LPHKIVGVFLMSPPVDICSLDYLTGTLATAYKGMITSLVARDFCMTEEEDVVTIKGTILAMPRGVYRAALISDGRELASAAIEAGFFVLDVDSKAVHGAGRLQMDIVQNGRHIGTFLLKRRGSDQFFSSAFEISGKLGSSDLKLLTAYVRDKPGLLKRAEEIIAHILSTKKDWRAFSEQINTFAKDLFWHTDEGFHRCYSILVRYAVAAGEKGGSSLHDKMIANVFYLAELPLEQVEDQRTRCSLLQAWLGELKNTSACLACNFVQARRAVREIIARCPGLDPSPVLRPLISSLREIAERVPAIPAAALEGLRFVLPPAEFETITGFGAGARRKVLEQIDAAEALIDVKSFDEFFTVLGDADSALSDDALMSDAFFSAAQRHLSPESAAYCADAVSAFLRIFEELSEDGRRQAAAGIALFLKRLIALGLTKTCESFIAKIDRMSFAKREDILLNVDIASAVLHAGGESLMRSYCQALTKVVVPPPGISGFSGETWAEIAHPLHIVRLSRFLDIIGLDSGKFKELVIHLICNLRAGGVFIPDDRLFQRNISVYLGSVKPGRSYLLDYMLLKMLPVYFNEVGATGRIRDYSTEIDSWGNDPVLYFLRKQVHVNASNNNIRLVQRIISAWVADEPAGLREAVPQDVFDRIDPALLKSCSAAVRPFLQSVGALDETGLHFEGLIGIPEKELRENADALDAPGEIRSKIFCLCRLYQELIRKYAFASNDPEPDIFPRLDEISGRLKALETIILSREQTRPIESFYFKRHIAFGIPSVMGSYHEPRFDAFSETLRLEERARVFLERMIQEIRGKERFAADDTGRWLEVLRFVNDLFRLHELGNFTVEELMTILEAGDLRISQVNDMLGIWQKELTWMMELLWRMFYRPLTNVLEIMRAEELPERLKALGAGPSFVDKAADVIMQDLASSIAGFAEADRLLAALMGLLVSCINTAGDREFLSAVVRKEEKEFYVMDELTDNDAAGLAPLIGGKAKNLVYLRNHGLSVPPGVVFSSAMTTGYDEYTSSARFRESLQGAVGEIEKRTGTVFGDGKNPLFVSVRSGSFVSMPGILSSVLYCGMNEDTLKGMIESTGNPRLGWDSYRRFIEHYGTVVHGLEAGVFDKVIRRFMAEKKIGKMEELDAAMLGNVARLHLKELSSRGLDIPDDVYEQLARSVRAIYASWHGKKASLFRKAMRVSAKWGTAVTVMQMVYGNDRGCGASVFFTRNPFSMERDIYGETNGGVTGADIVSGGQISMPLSRSQSADRVSLEDSDPELYSMHQDLGRMIENAMGGLPQEVEATYTKTPDGRRLIYALQSRRMEFHRGFRQRFDDVCRMESNIVGRGAGVHGGALSGVVTFKTSPAAVKKLKDGAAVPVILLRPMASTDDVSLMPLIDGILTKAGGVASHAAVLAQKFDLTAVVGCSDLEFRTDENGNPYAAIGAYAVNEGSFLSMDGSTGLVYSGLCVFTVPEKDQPDT
jgi:pyruvate,orthophosphate dikinase